LRKCHIKLTENQYILSMDDKIRVKNYKQRQIPFCYLEEGRLVSEIFTAFYLMIESLDYNEFIFGRSMFYYKRNGEQGAKTNLEKNHITSRRVHHILEQVSVKAGLNKAIHPHEFRHFYGTMMVKNNTRLEVLQSYMGHSTIDYTMKYVHLAAATQIDASKNNPLKDVKGKIINESLVKKIKKNFGV